MNIHCTGTHTECVGHIDDSGKKYLMFVQSDFYLPN
jgi:hypothetical protein